MNKEDYVSILHTLPCAATFIILGKRVKAQEVHHPEFIRDGLSDWMGIPLTIDMHRGANGIHGLSRRGFERRYKVTEMDLIAATIKLFNEGRAEWQKDERK